MSKKQQQVMFNTKVLLHIDSGPQKVSQVETSGPWRVYWDGHLGTANGAAADLVWTQPTRLISSEMLIRRGKEY